MAEFLGLNSEGPGAVGGPAAEIKASVCVDMGAAAVATVSSRADDGKSPASTSGNNRTPLMALAPAG
jgi:hypothetical protein